MSLARKTLAAALIIAGVISNAGLSCSVSFIARLYVKCILPGLAIYGFTT
jgi:hypothetical protein